MSNLIKLLQPTDYKSKIKLYCQQCVVEKLVQKFCKIKTNWKSTVFEANKGYSPASVFTMLECNNDTMLAYRKLTELGY